MRKWTFADARGTNQKMTLAIKDLLQLEKQNTGHQLSLYYASRELEKDELLSAIRF